ncbi:MAG TPA: hypothetical protein VNI54_11300 [Thermoanaerobaculia bacterium]|nr:hypothetical protein [Thermoanaerobaculia bacterium]
MALVRAVVFLLLANAIFAQAKLGNDSVFEEGAGEGERAFFTSGGVIFRTDATAAGTTRLFAGMNLRKPVAWKGRVYVIDNFGALMMSDGVTVLKRRAIDLVPVVDLITNGESLLYVAGWITGPTIRLVELRRTDANLENDTFVARFDGRLGKPVRA